MPTAPLPVNERRRLEVLRAYEILDTLPEGEFDDITRLASVLCGMPMAFISLIDEQRQWFKSRVGLNLAETSRDVAFCAHAILDPDHAMLVPDAWEDSRVSDNPLVQGENGLRFYAGWPLVAQSGEALGTLCVADTKPGSLTDLQQDALRILAGQVMAQMELRRSLARSGEIIETQRQLERRNQAITQQLSASEETFRLAMEHASIGMALVSPEGGWLKANKALCALLGYTEDELKQTDFQTITHPDDLQSDMHLVRQMLAREIPTYRLEKRYYRKDGEIIWVLLNVSLVWNADGTPNYFISQIQNITVQKDLQYVREQLIAELRAAESLKQGVLDSSNYIIVGTDTRGAVHTFNQAAEHALGYRAEEVLGRTAVPSWHDAEEIRQRGWELSQQLGRPIEGSAVFVVMPTLRRMEEREWTFVRKDGTRFPARLTVTALQNEEGEVSGYVGMAKDISAERQAEAQRRESEERLRQSEERLHLAASGTSDGLWDWNVTNGEIYYSPRFMHELGYAENELPYTIETFSRLLHPDDIEPTFKAVEADHRHIAPYNTEYRMRHKEGHYIWHNARGQTVWNEHDLPVRMTGYTTNIDKRKNAEQQREQLVAKLNESNMELERFAYVASHDMQEPLRMIANFSSLIGSEYGDKLDGEGQEYIALVTDAALRMQAMVNDLLEYARLGTEGLRIAEIDTEREFDHVLLNLSAALRDRNARVTHDPLPNIQVNAVQFMRLLQNLIGNGIKYQAENTVPQVHVRAQDSGDHWEFSVRDNGIGMAESHLGQIFEPYKRLHSWEEYKGTGIGLAVCKKIVENHGGSIWVTSEPNKGSVFSFTVPKIHQGAL